MVDHQGFEGKKLTNALMLLLLILLLVFGTTTVDISAV